MWVTVNNESTSTETKKMHTNLFQHCPDTGMQNGMQNGDMALPSISLARGGILLKILITLE